MATHTLQPGDRPANTDVHPSRRGIIAAMVLAPLAATPASSTALATDRSAWDRAFAAMQAAEQEDDGYYETVYKPLSAKLERIAPRPPLAFTATVDRREVEFNLYADALDRFDHYPIAEVREKASAQRNAFLRRQEASRRLGMSEVAQECDRLTHRACDLRSDLITMPAPDAAALLWKLEYMFGTGAREADEDGDGYCAAWTNAVMADARRLLGEAQA